LLALSSPPHLLGMSVQKKINGEKKRSDRTRMSKEAILSSVYQKTLVFAEDGGSAIKYGDDEKG